MNSILKLLRHRPGRFKLYIVLTSNNATLSGAAESVKRVGAIGSKGLLITSRAGHYAIILDEKVARHFKIYKMNPIASRNNNNWREYTP